MFGCCIDAKIHRASRPNLLVLDFPMNTQSGQTFVNEYVDLTTARTLTVDTTTYDLVAIIYNLRANHVTAELLVGDQFAYYNDQDGCRILQRNCTSNGRPSFHATEVEQGVMKRWFVGDRIAQLIYVRRP
jgi:hypothetical protein